MPTRLMRDFLKLDFCVALLATFTLVGAVDLTVPLADFGSFAVARVKPDALTLDWASLITLG